MKSGVQHDEAHSNLRFSYGFFVFFGPLTFFLFGISDHRKNWALGVGVF